MSCFSATVIGKWLSCLYLNLWAFLLLFSSCVVPLSSWGRRLGSWVGILLLAEASSLHVHKEKTSRMAFPSTVLQDLWLLKGILAIFVPEEGRRKMHLKVSKKVWAIVYGTASEPISIQRTCKCLVLLARMNRCELLCSEMCWLLDWEEKHLGAIPLSTK